MIILKDKVLLRKNKEKIENKKILLRVDYNVEIKNNRIVDEYRIDQSLETINFLKNNLAKQIIIVTHFGRPKNKERKYSIKNLFPYIKKKIKNLKFFYWKPGFKIPLEKILILENIRFFKSEEKNDINFSKNLSKLADVFVNDAFSVSHRKHSSIYGIKKFLPTFYGLNFEKEIKNINKVFEYIKNKKKIGIVIGGTKFETKIEIIENFLKDADLIILVGGIANTFLKSKGFNIGRSIIDKNYLKYAGEIYSPKILTPFDFITQNGYKYLGEIEKNDIIFDVGHESIKIFIEELKKMDCIVWNGPLGKIEEKIYSLGTKIFAKNLLKLKKFKIIGGGDTLKIIKKIKIKNTFISTGGGALLYYLAKRNLPIFE